MSFEEKRIVLGAPPPRQNVPVDAKLFAVWQQATPPFVRFHVELDVGESLTYEFSGSQASAYLQGVQNGAWVAQGITYTEWVLNYLIANTDLSGTVGDPA